ncbi:MAG TPA: dTDP-4-dehydrorhamnose 3,5-epimerase family protein [Fimbriimonas sp.]|nr:dTDP-4-dehydrorhamnose 3,5-epimerase family protein [Fimbriimonas sp.]
MNLAPGVVIKSLKSFQDSRGHLTELFRSDELPEGFLPTMSYISVTHPGVSRGPHEHVHQSDLFAFVDGEYELRLWENRPGYEPWEGVFTVGESNPVTVIVPPGVVHGYKNVGDRDAYVINLPDKLYAGEGRKEPVDEIRHEEIDSPFSMA